jgi:hypothetical protein
MAYDSIVTSKDQKMGIKSTYEESYIRKVFTTDNEHTMSA